MELQRGINRQKSIWRNVIKTEESKLGKPTTTAWEEQYQLEPTYRQYTITGRRSCQLISGHDWYSTLGL